MLQSNENRILCDFVAECTPAMDSDRDQSVNNYYDIIYMAAIFFAFSFFTKNKKKLVFFANKKQKKKKEIQHFIMIQVYLNYSKKLFF